jgi:hypothetical protein
MRASRPASQRLEQLAGAAKAFADPTRLAIPEPELRRIRVPSPPGLEPLAPPVPQQSARGKAHHASP